MGLNHEGRVRALITPHPIHAFHSFIVAGGGDLGSYVMKNDEEQKWTGLQNSFVDAEEDGVFVAADSGDDLGSGKVSSAVKNEDEMWLQNFFFGVAADEDCVCLEPSVVDVAETEGEEEECTDLEPFFFDEAEAVAQHAAAEEKRKKEAHEKELKAQKFKAYKDALDRIRGYDRKSGPYTRFHYVDLSTFDLDEECKPSVQ